MKTLLTSGPMGTALTSIINGAADMLPALYRCWKEKYKCCPDALSVISPWMPKALIYEYLKAGADIIITNTFLSNRLSLKQYGLPDDIVPLNQESVRIARDVINDFPDSNCLRKPKIAGAIGPIANIGTRHVSPEALEQAREAYFEQAEALIEAGADMLLFETSVNIRMLRQGLLAAFEAMDCTGRKLPVHVEFTLDMHGNMPDGTPLCDAMQEAEENGAASVGVNCVFPASRSARYLLEAAGATTLPLTLRPSLSLGPDNANGTTTPSEFAEAICQVASAGSLLFAGCCCGGSPAHLKALGDKLRTIQRN